MSCHFVAKKKKFRFSQNGYLDAVSTAKLSDYGAVRLVCENRNTNIIREVPLVEFEDGKARIPYADMKDKTGQELQGLRRKAKRKKSKR